MVAGYGAHPNKDADLRNLIKNNADQEKDTDQLWISTIKVSAQLTFVNRLKASQQWPSHSWSTFFRRTNLWNSYNNADIYEFLTGEKDTLPEFQFDWSTPEPTLRLSENLKDFIIPQPQNKQPQQPQPVQVQQVQPPQPQQEQPQPLLAPPTPPAAPGSDRVLHNKAPIDYIELHMGIKRKCKSLRRKAHTVVTKLAPGAFSL